MVAVHHDPNSNKVLAALLAEIAQLLRRDGASAYRVDAYERAADTIGDLAEPVETLYRQGGVEGLIAIPTIGHSIAGLIEHYFLSHRIPLLERLRGEDSAERKIASLPTVGPELARRIHQRLHIDTLPQLLAAANDGTLRQVPGIGEKRIQAIRQSLTYPTRPRNRIPRAVQLRLWDESSLQQVPIAELLDLDSEYRKAAAKQTGATDTHATGCLFQRDDRRYRVHFSDSPRAHQLHATRDWVVIQRIDVAEQDHWTVVTSFSGKLHGCRVVRGREEDCYRHYRDQAKRAVENYPMDWS
jgi:hypothetical protein